RASCCMWLHYFLLSRAAHAKMGPGVWAVIQPKDPDDDVSQVLRHVDSSRTAAIVLAIDLTLLEHDVKRRAQGANGALQHYSLPGDARLHDPEAVLVGERLDLGQVSRVGTMRGSKGFAGHVPPASVRAQVVQGRQYGARPHLHGHFTAFIDG